MFPEDQLPFKHGKAYKETHLQENPLVRCAICKEAKRHSRFEDEMLNLFVVVNANMEDVVCKTCERGHCHEKLTDRTNFTCMHCRRGDGVGCDWPESAFLPDDVRQHQLHQTPLKCAACIMESDTSAHSLAYQECSGCKRDVPLQGPPLGYSPTLLRQFLESTKSKKSKCGHLIWKDRWY